MNRVVIYHRADFDGIFCCEIARRYFALRGEAASFIGWDYGDPVPEIPLGTTIYMLDISIEQLMTRPELVWIDHHKSAIAKYGPRPGLQLDGVAACRLAWQWFFGPEREIIERFALPMYFSRIVEEPHAVTLAGEYDIWDKRDPDAELFQHGLRSCAVAWPVLLSDNRDEANAYVAQLLENGRVLQFARANENKSISTQQGFTLRWEGLTFAACNAARFNSLLFTAMLQERHDACLGFCWNGQKGKWKVSLYGVPGKPDVDLCAIAVRYGGGGHKQACGFECETLPFGLPAAGGQVVTGWMATNEGGAS